MQEDGISRICSMAQKIFSVIRDSVIKQLAPTTLQATLIQPVSNRVAEELLCQILTLQDAEFMSMFAGESPNVFNKE